MSIKIDESLVLNSPDSPLREGEIVETQSDILNIQSPRVGMTVYVRDEGVTYIIRSLKAKVIGGLTVQNAAVNEYEEYDVTKETERAKAAESSLKTMDVNLDLRTKVLEENAFTQADIQINASNQAIVFHNRGGAVVRAIPITPATTENAGVMTASDKKNLEALKNIAVTLNEGLTATNEKVNKIETKHSWSVYSNMNDFTTQGMYVITGNRNRTDDNLPISNTGPISARLFVMTSENGCITQTLMFNNGSVGDGNVYIRTYHDGAWGNWSKLQTNVEVNAIGLGQSKTFDDLTDNNMYSGINVYQVGTDSNGYPITSYETFVLVVLNGYLTGAGVTQLKYSLLIDGTTSVQTRTRQNDVWSEWSNIAGSGGSVEVPMATEDTAGIVKLGTGTLGTGYDNSNSMPITSNDYGLRFLYGEGLTHQGSTLLLKLGTWALTDKWRGGKGIPLAMFDDGLGINIDTAYFTNSIGVLGLKLGKGLTVDSGGTYGVSLKLGTARTYNADGIGSSNKGTIVPFAIGSVSTSDGSSFDSALLGTSGNIAVGIPIATNGGLELTGDGLKVSDNIGATKITWSDSSNMNDYTSAGVYDIYGERTNANDNLPITQAYSGASIAARLIVVASTLQPSNTEKCITQFLQLSNRMGGEGDTYIRTYNENNNGLNGWSAWKKQQGMVESYINTDSVGITITGATTTGLNGMTDNGMYSGIYTDDYTLASPTFVETFVLVVINDYAVSSQAGTPRRISQLKYATDTITGQCTVKKRIGTGADSISWSDWENIGGGSSEIDISDALRTYGLPTLASQELVKEGVTYVSKFTHDDFPTLDNNGYILDYLYATYGLGLTAQDVLRIKYTKNSLVYGTAAWFEIDAYVKDGDYIFGYDRFIISDDFNTVKVSHNTIKLPNTITFTINGNTYTAEKGMTWGQWLNSAYPGKGNYQNFLVSGNIIMISAAYIKGDNNENRHIWDVLNDGEVFEATYNGGGGSTD